MQENVIIGIDLAGAEKIQPDGLRGKTKRSTPAAVIRTKKFWSV